jgi:hypothetical protein
MAADRVMQWICGVRERDESRKLSRFLLKHWIDSQTIKMGRNEVGQMENFVWLYPFLNDY